ncbi:MAG: GNAT family N-acetyltransferase [Bdellovibrionales bacterium]|nr:GNAT family N-acetyltransferase [Bdellovibrionales bacterium]
MSRIRKTEHAGAKNGGGYWGTREEAKALSKKLRRATGKKIVQKELKTTVAKNRRLSTQATFTLPQLETERLILRPLRPTDAENIFEYAKNPNVSLFTLWEPHKNVTDSLKFITEYAQPLYKEQVPEPFGIILKSNPKKVIGTVGCFWVSKPSQTMELAYAIDEPFWGKGLVAEASDAILGYCFKNLKVNRIQSRCKAENKASSRVMEKVGMKYEGTLKSAIFHRNRFWDMHYYAILKADWAQKS